MKITFYYVRHGETLFNKKSRIQGVCDSPLTPLGVQQANQAKEALTDVYFDHVFCSPSGRCQQTSKIILEGRNVLPTIENNLHEFDFGYFEGSRFTSHPDEIRHCFDTRDFSSVKGESPSLIQERIDTLFEDLLTTCHDGEHVLLVSHGYLEIFVIEHLLHENFEQFAKERESKGRNPIPNAGIMTFTYEDGEFKVIHLPSEPTNYVAHKESKTIHFLYCNHGQTRFNEANRMQGVSDAPLTQRGIHESEQCARALENISVNAIYTSPLTRCIDLANMIAHDRNITPIITDGLKDIDYGEFEGVVRDSWLQEIHEHRKNHDDYSDVGGESQEVFEKRVKHCMHKIISSSKDGSTVVLVGHSEYYKRMLEILFGLEAEATMMQVRMQGEKPHPYGGIFTFDYTDGNYEIVSLMKEAVEQ